MTIRPVILSRVILLPAAVIAAGFAMFPLYWALMSALRPSEDIFRMLSPLSIWAFVPNRVTLQNVLGIWSGPFALAMLNSLLVTALTVAGGLVICAMAAFALARLRVPFAGMIFSLVVVSFLVPFDAISIPLATLFREFGLQNSYLGLILPGLGNGFAVFLLRQFFLAIPKELSEAARMDGLGWFGIFLRIYLPLSKPALVGAGLILFIFQWQAFLWPLLIAPDPSYKVAAVAIADLSGQFATDYGMTFAAAVFVAVVPLVILLLFQRNFSGSISATGGKE
jgi:putative chitobiose transport system permease protein